jgi:threonyl-tRNA synthetase
VFWHSTAHILGEAMERVYGGCLCYGPPIENGFYYDMFIEDKQVSLLMWNFASACSENHINYVCF